MFDASTVRSDFPILRERPHDKPLVYLDSAATAQKPRAVLERERRFYEEEYANVHRGVHVLAERATLAYEGARERMAAFLGVPSPDSLIWTRGTTESLNLVAYAWARHNLREGDEILLTIMEHHSNIVPWQLVAGETGAVLRYVPVREDYTLDLDRYRELLGRRTRLVALCHMSNVLGTINPIRDIARDAHRVGAVVVVDGAQAVPHLPFRLPDLECDFYAFSGHKMMGPTGVGLLYGRPELLDAMPPFLGGGEMISEVNLDRSTYKPVPHKFEAGTPPIGQAVGLAAAAEYLAALGMDDVRAHEEELTAYTLEVLDRVGGVVVHGPPRDRGGVFSFAVDGLHPHDVATILDAEGVAVRAGHHCAQPLMKWLAVPATARASIYVYNTEEDIDRLAQAIERAKSIFGTAGQPA
jgi:cysteine desulfurase/selenocysteine lyase